MNFLKSIFRTIKSIILSIFLVCLVAFMVNNRETATLHLSPLPFNIETKMFIILIVFFVLGMLFGFLSLSQNLIGKTMTNIFNRHKIKKLEQEIIKK